MQTLDFKHRWVFYRGERVLKVEIRKEGTFVVESQDVDGSISTTLKKAEYFDRPGTEIGYTIDDLLRSDLENEEDLIKSIERSKTQLEELIAHTGNVHSRNVSNGIIVDKPKGM